MIYRINKAIEDSLSELKVNALGIAEPIVIRDGNDVEIPAIILSDGECLSVLDDDSDVCCYHKITKKTYSTDNKGGYGDSKKVSSESDMSLVIYGFRTKITPYDAEQMITKAIMGLCTVTSVDFNRNTLFYQEYSGIRFFLQPDVFLIKINYKLKEKLNSCSF